MKHAALTYLEAKNLAAGKHADGEGLWLVKRSKSSGRWVLRLVIHGKRREMGLGRFPGVSIGEAREKAEDARKLARASVDPIFERKRAKATAAPLTLKQAVEGCFEARKAELKADGEAGRWMSALSVHIIPKIGSYPVHEVDQHVLKEVLEPIWNKKPEAAVKALNRLNLTLKHAAALGIAVDLQATMKARALLGKQRRTEVHIPSLAYEDAPEFYRSLGTNVSALALRFLMLTLARGGEVRGTPASEIDGDAWDLPGKRTKTGVGRRIPLVKEAVRVVKLCGDGELLFPGPSGKPISDMAMTKLMRDRGMVARPHGFRATFRTWAEEQTDTAFEVKEAVLGHMVDSGIVGAYQRSDRSDKRRKLMEKWERFLLA